MKKLWIFFFFSACAGTPEPIAPLSFVFDFDNTFYNGKKTAPYVDALFQTALNRLHPTGPCSAKAWHERMAFYGMEVGNTPPGNLLIAQDLVHKCQLRVSEADVHQVVEMIQKTQLVELGNLMKRLSDQGFPVIVLGGGIWGCAVISQVLAPFGMKKSQIYSGPLADFSDVAFQESISGPWRYQNCADKTEMTPLGRFKSKVIAALKANHKLTARVVHVGDGENDLEVWKAKEVETFIGFGLHVQVPEVKKEAPVFVTTWADFEKALKAIQ